MRMNFIISLHIIFHILKERDEMVAAFIGGAVVVYAVVMKQVLTKTTAHLR